MVTPSSNRNLYDVAKSIRVLFLFAKGPKVLLHIAQIRRLLLASSIHPPALQRMLVPKNNPYLAHSVFRSV